MNMQHKDIPRVYVKVKVYPHEIYLISQSIDYQIQGYLDAEKYGIGKYAEENVLSLNKIAETLKGHMNNNKEFEIKLHVYLFNHLYQAIENSITVLKEINQQNNLSALKAFYDRMKEEFKLLIRVIDVYNKLPCDERIRLLKRVINKHPICQLHPV